MLGRAPDVVVSAPGRVNLIGEHTDYNDGFVLPTVIPQRTFIAVSRRDGSHVRAHSETLGGDDGYELGREARVGRWIDYLQGVTHSLAKSGRVLRGFDVVVASDVPVGSGLSSSAALEVAMMRALRATFELELDDVELARLAQRGENEIVGAPVGILDPLACSLGEIGSALFVDTRSLGSERIVIPRAVELVVVDSGVAHDHVQGGYRERRAQCEEAARRLGVRALRDVGEDDLARIASLRPPLDRRARHVVTENARVLRAVDAMRRDDVHTLGALFDASHESMRDDFEVSVPRVDRLVERAKAHPEVIGARLTGGGFGGAIVALARAGHGADAASAIAAEPGARALVPPPPR
ncbi:Galactokinase [Sandaracinus amylolyticus]|uniref:Galactokinase n=1 Tax=Sandaracinus amylolyticus TaxID=927083 RepID=A0A0F6W037_9BACT|nr:Galactokinase [Sandaracinus amylolyticus]